MPHVCSGPIRGAPPGGALVPHSSDASVYIAVVRHGERLDEVNRDKWRRMRTKDNAHDPPLTAAGWEQGLTAGRAVAAAIAGDRGKEPQPVTLYSSPTARTLATAAAMAPDLQVESIVPAYALNCCAAAKDLGVARAFPSEPPAPEALGGVPLACWPPRGDPDAVDGRVREDRGGFVQAVSELAAGHAAGEVVVMVTHREGIWELQNHARERMGAKYCSVHYYAYDLHGGALSCWRPTPPEPGHARAQPGRSPARLKQGAGSALRSGSRGSGTKSSASSTELAALLQHGAGRIAVGAAGGVRLWRTPGVADVWVGPEALPPGEELELLSGPQSSEGPEGELFVFVGRASGERGWLRVVDVRAPARA